MLRFAPSPTGDMHIGNLRIAILNYIVAQQKKDRFLVRIDDTNSKRNIEGKDTEIMMLLEKFALKHDAVFHQSEHLNIHQTLAIRLLDEGKAFICSCSDEQIEADREVAKANNMPYRYSGHCQELTKEEYTELKESSRPFVIRIKKPDEAIVYHDLLKGEVTTDPYDIDSLVILRSDSTPTHNFATACDDMLSDINYIICGEEHFKDTPKQIHIKNLLGYQNDTAYLHLPMILNEEGKKMGKEDELSSLKWLFEQGFLPDAILNYLLLLGHKAPQEIFTLPEAIKWFDINSISQLASQFDISKLRYINREHLKMMNDKLLSTLFGFADADIGKLAKVYLEECSTINELKSKIRPIFSPKNFNGEWGAQMRVVEKIIFNAPAFDTFDALTKHITNESGLKGKNLYTPLRYLLTATGEGPELSEIYPYIKSYILEVAS